MLDTLVRKVKDVYGLILPIILGAAALFAYIFSLKADRDKFRNENERLEADKRNKEWDVQIDENLKRVKESQRDYEIARDAFNAKSDDGEGGSTH